MLILTRKLNQSVTIGKDIKITVIQINKGSVKIGVSADRDISIARDEIKMDKEKNEFTNKIG